MNAPDTLTHELTTLDAPTAAPSLPVMLDPQRMRALIDFSHLMAESAITVPKHLQGKPADCMAIAMQAMQWGMNPFAVAQKTHVVNGALGYEAQLVNAVVQTSGAIVGAFRYEYRGDGNALECRVGATLRGEADVTWGEWLKSGDVQTKNSPLWKVNPRQQLGYLQVKNWARLYCPGAILGVYTADELDVLPAEPAPEPEQRGPRRRSAAPAPAEVVEAAPSPEREVSFSPAEPPEPARPQRQATAPAAAGAITAGQVAYLRNKLQAAGMDEPGICDRYSVGGIELLTPAQFDELKAELLRVL